jgi:hypothetical protein
LCREFQHILRLRSSTQKVEERAPSLTPTDYGEVPIVEKLVRQFEALDILQVKILDAFTILHVTGSTQKGFALHFVVEKNAAPR